MSLTGPGTLQEMPPGVSTKIHAGTPLWGTYPPGEGLKAEYKAPSPPRDPYPVSDANRPLHGSKFRRTPQSASWPAATREEMIDEDRLFAEITPCSCCRGGCRGCASGV